jgi:hypothetical protein
VSDGVALLGAVGPDAAREWMFVLGRPQLVVADGPFASVAHDDGIDVIAFAGFDRMGLLAPTIAGARCVVVPVYTGRPAAAYTDLRMVLDEAFRAAMGETVPEL